MAQFGIPGGVEAAAIVAIVLLLFLPGIVVFGAGFLFGKKSAERQAGSHQPPQSEPAPEEDTDAEQAEKTDGEADV